MFQRLDDPTPPVASDRHRQGVALRVRRHRLRRRGLMASASTVPVLLAVALVAAAAGDPGTQRVDVGGGGTETTAAPDSGNVTDDSAVDHDRGATTTTAGAGEPKPAAGRTATTARSSIPAKPASPSQQGESPTTTSAAPTTTIPPASKPGPHRYCSQPSGGQWNAQSEAEFTAKVVGTWLTCSTPTPWHSHEAGIDVAADYTWAKLMRTPEGDYVRMKGGEDSGWWTTDQTSPTEKRWTVSFFPDRSERMLCIVSEPVFAAAVPRMRLDNEGADASEYVEPPAGEVRIR